MIDWYRLPSKTTQGVILIIAMSNSPMKLTAGRIVYISLATFGNVGFYILRLCFAIENVCKFVYRELNVTSSLQVFKTSFAYLNFIRNAVM